MKKLILFSLALGLSMSACTILDPIPIPIKDYIRLQAFTLPDHEPLCDLEWNSTMTARYRGIYDENDVNTNLTGNVVVVPFGEGVKTLVWLETDYPWVTLNPGLLDLTLCANGAPLVFDAAAPIYKSLTYADNFVMTWPEKEVLLSTPTSLSHTWFYLLPIPRFSREVTIERINPYFYTTGILPVFHAIADDDPNYGHNPIFTGFAVQFGSPESAVALLADAITAKDLQDAIVVGPPHTLDLPYTNTLIPELTGYGGPGPSRLRITWSLTTGADNGDATLTLVPPQYSISYSTLGDGKLHLTATITCLGEEVVKTFDF